MTKLLQKYLVLILLFLMTTAYSTPMSTCKTGEPISNSVIEYYANSALNSIFSFNFIDYKEKIPSFNEYLNEDAWKEYLRVINDSHLSDDLIKEKLLVNAYFKTPAQVVNQNGKVWQVKAPIVINLQSATEYRNVRKAIIAEGYSPSPRCASPLL